MPFSLFGQTPNRFDFGQSFSSPGLPSLSLEDLYQPRPQLQMPEPPQQMDFAGLDPARKREYRQQLLLLAAQALGQGASNGQVGTALAGAAGAGMRLRGQVVDEANEEAQRRYQAAREQANAQAENERTRMREEVEKRQAQARLALVTKITQEEPDYADRAQAAALSGDDKSLRELADNLGRRKQMRSYGLDPDDPFADERMKGLMENQAKLDYERTAKSEGLDDYFSRPGEGRESIQDAVRRAGAVAEAQARAYAKYRKTGDAADLMKIMESGDVPYLLSAEGGVPKATPFPIPEKPDWVIGPPDFKGNRTYIDRNHPERGAFPVPPGGKPPPAVDQGVSKVRAAIGGLDKAEEAVVRSALAQGMTADQVIARIKAKRGVK